tara:strand:- start:3952 stop:4671 length:720 start_codon:yes stop_codon:yes gene_type:complete
MKTMNTITSKFKIALVAVGLLTIGSMSAQRTDTSTNAATDFTKQTNTVLGEDGGSVKVIDNKGTIKYLQASNGITTFTDTAPNGGVITTWQLGGTLTDDTYIDATGQVFAISGIKAIDATTNPVTDISATAYDSTGFTLLLRDEATGEFKKMLITDLVSGIRKVHTQGANAAADVAITVSGLPALTAGTTEAKLFVYRNGAKLRSGVDFVATADTVTIQYDAAEMPMYAGDIVEVQYIK